MTIALWSDIDPISLPMLNINCSQTRIVSAPCTHRLMVHSIARVPSHIHTIAPSHIHRSTRTRKSRLVKIAEWVHGPVDDHLKERLDRIFMARERYAFELKQDLACMFTALHKLHCIVHRYRVI